VRRFDGDTGRMRTTATRKLKADEFDDAIEILEVLQLLDAEDWGSAGLLGYALIERESSRALPGQGDVDGPLEGVEVSREEADRLKEVFVRAKGLLEFATRVTPQFALGWDYLGESYMLLG